MNKDIRWKQRFQNFQKVCSRLEAAIGLSQLTELERSGLIQTFEFTFELAWKTLKDHLESEGIVANTPREVIQQAFKAQFITKGHSWIDALEKRNLLAHSYDEGLSLKAEELIKAQYFPFLKEFKEQYEKRTI